MRGYQPSQNEQKFIEMIIKVMLNVAASILLNNIDAITGIIINLAAMIITNLIG